MEEVQNLCPLVTQYATSDIYNVIERPFSALDEATLERLYLIRRWPIDVEKTPYLSNDLLQYVIFYGMY